MSLQRPLLTRYSTVLAVKEMFRSPYLLQSGLKGSFLEQGATVLVTGIITQRVETLTMQHSLFAHSSSGKPGGAGEIAT